MRDLKCLARDELRNDVNVNVEVKRLVNTRSLIINVILVFDGLNFELEVGRLFKATSKVETPDASLFDHFDLLAFVTAHNLVFDVIL